MRKFRELIHWLFQLAKASHEAYSTARLPGNPDREECLRSLEALQDSLAGCPGIWNRVQPEIVLTSVPGARTRLVRPQWIEIWLALQILLYGKRMLGSQTLH